MVIYSNFLFLRLFFFCKIRFVLYKAGLTEDKKKNVLTQILEQYYSKTTQFWSDHNKRVNCNQISIHTLQVETPPKSSNHLLREFSHFYQFHFWNCVKWCWICHSNFNQIKTFHFSFFIHTKTSKLPTKTNSEELIYNQPNLSEKYRKSCLTLWLELAS